MKTLHVLILLQFLGFFQVYSQTEDNKLKELQKEKLLLIQKLFSCQSLANSTSKEIDTQTRYQYISLGKKYYNDAYQSYLKIQVEDPDIDSTLSENISLLLQLYAKSFENIQALYKSEMVLALDFGSRFLEKVVIDLYCKDE